MYNWTPEFPGGVQDNWDFVPMLWGWKFASDSWFDQVGKSGSKYVMSVNECVLPSILLYSSVF